MIQVSTQAELRAALDARENEIQVIADFEVNAQQTVNFSLLLHSAPSAPVHTISKTAGFSSSLLRVTGGGALTLEDIILDGSGAGSYLENPANRTLVQAAGGNIHLGSGAVLQNNSSYQEGGGLYLSGDSSYVNSLLIDGNAVIRGCNSRTSGGGLMAALRNNGDSVRLEGVAVIEQNTAANGAGVYLRSYLADVGGDISIGGQAQIRNNQAAGNGGGIFCSSFSAGGGGALSLTVEEEVELASNQAASGGGIYHSGERVLALFDAHFDGNTAAAGLGIYNAGPLTFNPVEELGSVVADIRDGLYLQDEDAIPMLYGKLALDSIIQLERSEYVVPNQTGPPIVVAVSTPQMSPGDAAAFRVPDSGFDGWTIRISDDGYEALLVPEQYAIRYENTLGAENPNPVSYTILTSTITLLPLADTGDYRFIGWFDAMEGGTQVTEIPLGSTGDETLYAWWRSLLHTLTYYGNDGGGTPAENIPLPQPVREGEGATLSEERPTREGYVFAAWNTDPSGSGTTYQPGDTIANVTADISLYAQWEAVPPTIYLITYEPNGLSVEGLPEQQEVSEGQTVSLSTAFPTRSGYRFLNWNSQPDGSGVVYQPGQTAGPFYTNLTLYAQWQWVGYILTYHGNDAGESATQGIPAPVIVPEGQSVTLSAMNPTRGGFAFFGWNTEPSGTGTDYQPGDTITNVRIDIDLNAQWISLSS